MLRSFARAALAVLLLTASSARAAEWPDISKPPTGTGGGPQDAALVIGIGDYDALSDIPGASQAAVDWYQWLVKTRGVSVGRTKLIRDSGATREEILEAAKGVADRVGPGGTLWFVFVGHGAPSQDAQDGVLVGADARQTASSLYARSVSRAELMAILETGPQEHTVVVLDACFSGKAEGGAALVDGLQPTLLSGTWKPARSLVLSAGRSDQFAGPLPGAARPAFSYLLLGALRGWGDHDGDGQITAREALDYTADALYGLPIGRAQNPELHGDHDTLVLAHGREQGPDLGAFVVDIGPSSISDLNSGPVRTGSSSASDNLADQLAQLTLAQQQREAAEAAAEEAARLERELAARLAAEREAKLDDEEESLAQQAAETWAAVSPLTTRGGPEAIKAVKLFLRDFDGAEVWIEDDTGKYRRAVELREVKEANRWLERQELPVEEHRVVRKEEPAPPVDRFHPPLTMVSKGLFLDSAGAHLGYRDLDPLVRSVSPACAKIVKRRKRKPVGGIMFGVGWAAMLAGAIPFSENSDGEPLIQATDEQAALGLVGLTVGGALVISGGIMMFPDETNPKAAEDAKQGYLYCAEKAVR
jgi:hypothetical protein